MRYVLAFILVLSMVGAASAYDLGIVGQEKTDVYPEYQNPEVRQGGDTTDTATPFDAIPYTDSGTTVGYTDDYDEACPYTISTSPDVCYVWTPGGDVLVDVDMLGSTYDTKLYIYDGAMSLVACNDDFYPDYVSKLENVQLMGGTLYYFIVDGYGGDFGDYVFECREAAGPCELTCPPEAFLEGEPTLEDGYVDNYNGGCNSDEPWPFQYLDFGPSYIDFCGVAGWYLSDGSSFRDTDWFGAYIGENGFIEVTADAESSTYIFELDIPPDCAATVTQNILVGPCAPASMTVFNAPGALVWLWAGSSNFTNPGDVIGNEYDYILSIDGLQGSATEASTWSQVKGLYR